MSSLGIFWKRKETELSSDWHTSGWAGPSGCLFCLPREMSSWQPHFCYLSLLSSHRRGNLSRHRPIRCSLHGNLEPTKTVVSIWLAPRGECNCSGAVLQPLFPYALSSTKSHPVVCRVSRCTETSWERRFPGFLAVFHFFIPWFLWSLAPFFGF